MAAMARPDSAHIHGGSGGLIRSAKLLLENHSPLLRRKAVINARLDRFGINAGNRGDEEIAEMALGRRALDGLPKAGRKGSSTEYIALHYGARLQEAAQQEIAELTNELSIIELNLEIYDAMIKSLNMPEALLVRLHYDEGIPFAKIAENHATSKELQIYSASTLKRLNQRILNKIDGALSD